MIAVVMLWSTGTVAVFDEHGQPMPDYQGPFLQVRQRILADAPPDARFSIGDLSYGQVSMRREAFASEAWLIREGS